MFFDIKNGVTGGTTRADVDFETKFSQSGATQFTSTRALLDNLISILVELFNLVNIQFGSLFS